MLIIFQPKQFFCVAGAVAKADDRHGAGHRHEAALRHHLALPDGAASQAA